MKLTFLGTRGNIEERSERHFRHTSLMVAHREKRVMIDCGEDWLGEVERLAPSAIVLTHAHPDHAWGLRAGAPCPVYATGEAWENLGGFPVAERDGRSKPAPSNRYAASSSKRFRWSIPRAARLWGTG